MKQKKEVRLLLPSPKPAVWKFQALSVVVVSSFIMLSLVLGFSYLVIQTRQVAFEASRATSATSERDTRTISFPVGVNPVRKTITENIAVDTYFDTHAPSRTLAINSNRNWFGRIVQKLAVMDWYQNLASPTGRMLVIASGERKEEVTEHFGKILGWSEAEKKVFVDTVTTSTPKMSEGTFFPSTYVVARGATPLDVAPLVTARFKSEVLSRYKSDVETIVPIKDALIIASLLEREAYDFEDMRFISGVIWNRLFIGMNLQIDATLQYAKANEHTQSWWPEPVPADKTIRSEFNTYRNDGLPPAPIANPSLDAILAALNPRKTDCLFYFHDSHAGFHCSKTYSEHVALLREYYGKGR